MATFTKKNSYVINGVTLQQRIAYEMQEMFDYLLEWNGDTSEQVYYEIYSRHESAFVTLLEIQGNSPIEARTILDYYKDVMVEKVRIFNKF